MKTKPKRFKSQRHFASALKCSPATLCKLLKRDDWPARRAGPWNTADVATVQRWRLECLREDRAALQHRPMDPDAKPLRLDKLAQEARKLKAQADLAELELGRQKGKLIDADEAMQNNLRQIYAVKAKMYEFPLRAALLVGKSEPQCEVILREWMDEACDCFSGERYTESAAFLEATGQPAPEPATATPKEVTP